MSQLELETQLEGNPRCELVYYEVDLSITLSIASVFWQSWLHYGWASAFSCRNSMSDWPNFQLENFATHSPWGCLPVFCANESWVHQKSKGKCLGSMDRLRGITVSWRSGSSNLSTWRVYLLPKILTRWQGKMTEAFENWERMWVAHTLGWGVVEHALTFEELGRLVVYPIEGWLLILVCCKLQLSKL